MPPTPRDARLTELPDGQIPSLAELYDKFAHSFEPFSEERDRAENVFKSEVSSWYDLLSNQSHPITIFRRR
jgi:hypothetical protein